MARGQLRIYLGAAPGVGKTVSMLAEGRRRADRGTDVVVALVETHGRTFTAGSLEGLEVVPRRTVTHQGATLTEMDLDAVLARKPEVALVDELAHTNVPGSRHEKRWQDVQDLLNAGIDVISTVNIQHLESLNDATRAITGVTQRETVPDDVVRAADQVELVDMSPEALRRRMSHGNVYAPERIDAALANYFRPGNLSALRELALLWLADRVDEGLARYRQAHDIDGTWPTRERVVVALTGGPEGATLLRRGARLAARGAGGELIAVHVARTDGLSGPPLANIGALQRLTSELGGAFHTVAGDDVAEAVLTFAKGVNASQIVLGSSRRSRAAMMLSPGVGERITAGSGEIDVVTVTHGEASKLPPTHRQRSALAPRRIVLGWVSAVVGTALLTALLLAVPTKPDLPLIVLVYLTLTVAVALVGGLWPAVGAAILGYLAINWFFTPPVHTLTIADPQNSLALVCFIVVAIAVATAVHGQARRAAQAIAAQQEASALVELSHTLLSSTDQLERLLTGAVESFGATGAAVVRRPVPGTSDDPSDPVGVVQASADFPADAVRGGRPVSPELAGLPNGTEIHREGIDDTHDLILVGPPIPAHLQGMLSAYAAHAAAILTRRELQRSTASERTLTRDNLARTALLSAVSHDLRTPLAGIKAAVGSLRSTEVDFSPEDEAELLEVVEVSADRLDALIGNLLDASRVQAQALTVRPAHIDLADLVPSVIRTLTEPGRVSWSVDDDARAAWGDAGLLERVIANLAENAIRHAPTGTGVHIGVSALGDRVEIRVVDRGPGVPQENRESIFLPFQRYGDAPSGDGVGLGLAVARGLTEAMGGTLSADDTPGGGLTMCVTLARSGPDAADEEASPAPFEPTEVS